MTERVVVEGGPPWGFRLLGTASKESSIVISQVNPGSPADKAGLKSRDIIEAINGIVLNNCNLDDAKQLIRDAPSGSLHLVLKLASAFDVHPVQARIVEPEIVQKAKKLEKPRPIGKKGAYGSLVTMGKEFESVRLENAASVAPAVEETPRWKIGSEGVFCKTCGKPITDTEYFSVKFDHYHKECFVCAAMNCQKNLMGGYFTEQGRHYCESCHKRYFSKPCMSCQKPIFEDAFRALNLQWHLECFLCVECNQPPAQGGFHLENGKVYCDADHQRLFMVYCFKCDRPIVAGQSEIYACERKWHDFCFNCTKCGKNLNGKRFIRRGGLPRCPHCR